jgi:predicted transcriptional regulator
MSRKLEEFINSLTEEEKVRFKDIIQEALERDRLIKENTEKALKALSAFSSSGSLIKTLQEVAEKLERIKENLQALRYTLYLKSIPDSKFYRV